MTTDKNIVLVLGNGFDMDLGRKTSYVNFVSSEFWPFDNASKGLGAWLNKETNNKKWYDLEMLLRIYAYSKNNDFDLGNDKKQFDLLKHQIGEFLKEAEKGEIKKSSMAYNLLWWLTSFWRNVKVYTFNYTNFQTILKEIGIKDEVHCEYIHGNLSSQTQIVGIDDNIDVREGYEFLYKTFQSSYHSHNLLNDMRNADCVIFFGLCFGDIDYPYFKLFFQERCNEELYRKDYKKKFICFFTKDDNSEIAIKKNLMKMNDKKMMQLYAFNELSFFHEDNDWQRSKKIDDYFNLKLGMFLRMI